MGGSEAGGGGRPDCRWLEAGQKDGQGWHNNLSYPSSRTFFQLLGVKAKTFAMIGNAL